MQVTELSTPKPADIKRQLQVSEHELDEITLTPQSDSIAQANMRQALYRVREAIAHLEAAEKASR